MPKSLQRFDGHKWSADPRSNVTAAHACTWPTMPAERYLITSDNATGIFSFLTTNGMLMERIGWIGDHDTVLWRGPLNIVPVLIAAFVKHPHMEMFGYNWTLYLSLPLCTGGAQGTWPFPAQPCNKDILLGNIKCIFQPSLGETGNDLQARQVEYDQTVPPEGYP